LDLLLRAVGFHPAVVRPNEALIQHWPRDPRLLRYRENAVVDMRANGDLAAMHWESAARETRSVRFETDGRGFRKVASGGGRTTVILLGDSVGAGSGTTAGSTCADLLTTIYGHNVVNLSVGGSNAWQEYATLRYETDHLQLGPDQTVLWLLFPANDLEGEFGPVGTDLQLADPGMVVTAWRRYATWRNRSPIASLFGRSGSGQAGQVLAKVLPGGDTMLFYAIYAAHLHLQPGQVESHPTWPAIDATLAAMVQLGQDTGVRVVACLLPSKADIYSWVLLGTEPFAEPIRSTASVAALARHARAAGLEVHDLTAPLWEAAREAWQNALLWWRDDTHPNPSGHATLARLLDDVLRQ
jgi:lysophospholipase L1-like esterase